MTTTRPAKSAPTNPLANPILSNPLLDLPGATTEWFTFSQPVPNLAQACEHSAAGNCEAEGESIAAVSGEDPNPIWRAPVPTTIPATPPMPRINEPPSATAQGAEALEQSGGGSGVVVTEGGGPTLASCMALWEPAVHMSKDVWKNVCKRTMNGINQPQEVIDSVDPSAGASHHARPARHIARN